MHRSRPTLTAFPLLALAAIAAASMMLSGCGGGTPAEAAIATPGPAVDIAAAAAIEQPISRFIRVTGSLTAEDQASVAAEVGARVVATPVERGQPVVQGQELVRLSSQEAEAQLKEAEANAAQIVARLGLTSESGFSPESVPEVQTAKAGYALAQSDFDRSKSLLDQGVIARSEFDQRRAQLDASHQQYESAKNAAAQQYQSLQAASARVTLARKALADTTVRAPFAGIVAERSVSIGDYVTKGTRVATVVRVNPLRVRLTVPEQFISAVGVGQRVSFEVNAYPGRQFEGTVRYVSPALETSQRALTVEAVVGNPGAELKPGFFATARLQQPAKTPAVLVPSAAVRASNGTSRVFVVAGDHVEERIVTIGDRVDERVEITSGLKAGERVATTNVEHLNDGTKVS